VRAKQIGAQRARAPIQSDRFRFFDGDHRRPGSSAPAAYCNLRSKRKEKHHQRLRNIPHSEHGARSR
jgi:hypothetical protein